MKARPRQRDRAISLAIETPSETRPDFFRRRIARRRSSRESDRGSGSTEWRCQQHPSRGCSFAGHQPQPSANVNHEYTRMNTNRFHKPRIARMTRMRLGVRGHVRAFKAATRRRTPKRPRRNCLLFDHEEHEAWRSADFRRFRFMNQEKRKSGNGDVGLKLVRLPRSLAATLAVLPSISEIPFLDSAFLLS